MRDTATKCEILNELRRRDADQTWKSKVEQIEQGRSKAVTTKIK